MIANLTLIAVLSPLLGCLIAGLLGSRIGPKGAHRATILLMIFSFISAVFVAKAVLWDGHVDNVLLYKWAISGSFEFDIGFLIDPLTAVMMVVVTFVSLVVHVYSVGYMQGDPGYQRFFSYVSLFTFAMLMLVTANNFLQLFFGWEGVGLVSYLLIGFWFKTKAAANGSFKAFIVNRVGDMGFLLGIAAILDYMGSINYADVFSKADGLANATITIIPGHEWSLMTVICILLFIGAMGKSAQVPLHVWLPESMAGPTPISALIHAATMVTAGVFMVARMSPLFELSTTALTLVLVIGATGALFLGLLAFVENDIKRVIAYSTMSQLGYMMAANGASAFSAGLFHLMTHACFKALLFLAAGSVIIAMHHEQDLRKMGGLRKYMPITYVTFLIGALALAAIPPFSGFYSKDAIIEAVHLATLPGASYAYWCLLIGSFVTAYYIFRAFFLAFHGEERFDNQLKGKIHETSWSMTVPLIALAIPSVFLGGLIVNHILYQTPGLFGDSLYVTAQNNVLAQMATSFQGAIHAALTSIMHPPFWMAAIGVLAAWFSCLVMPSIRTVLAKRFAWLRWVLEGQYGFDAFNQRVIVRGTQIMSDFFYQQTDLKLIDSWMVDGSGRGISRISQVLRRLQTGYLYHYALVMIIGLLALLAWLLFT